MTGEQFRRLALELPDTIESAHMRHPDFRVSGRVFATLGYPGRGWGMVKLDLVTQEFLVRAHPEMFSPVKGAWGENGATNIRLAAAREGPLRKGLEAAWQVAVAK